MAMVIIGSIGISGCGGAKNEPQPKPKAARAALAGPADIADDRELVIVDSSVMLDARADNASDGHWSFRWLMEQMAPPDSDPADFVETWLQGFLVTQINSFAVDQRQGVNDLIARWRDPDTGKLDLAHSPFRLLAIMNRIDINFAGSPGEGRFVFGLVDANGQGQPMTINFEYRLPPLGTDDDRREWAQRWHALGALPFGDDYNQALQAVTDTFASRDADPSRPGGSSLGQLRVNEIALGTPWELREFNLISENTGVALRPVTTKQNPDQSLNQGDQLAFFIIVNAQAIHQDLIAFPPPFLGGAAPETNPTSNWQFPAHPEINESLRHDFAIKTCNGCHNAETQQLDRFYHVTPLGPTIVDGDDGQGRLSDFVKLVDRPFRVTNLQALLTQGKAAVRPSSRVH